MGFTERLMAPGRWELALDQATPEKVLGLAETKGFARLIVTPTHVDPRDVTPDDLLGFARYSGIYRRHSRDRTRWSGAGLAILLGDEDGKGPVYTAPEEIDVGIPKFDGSNTSWIRSRVLRVASGKNNGIVPGNIASSSTPTKTGNIEAGDTPRDVLDWVCRVFTTDKANPQEWRINPDGTLDQRNRQVLYPTTTAPTAIALRSERASTWHNTGGLRAVPVESFAPDGDWEDWTSATTAVGPTVTLFGTPYTFTGRDEIAANPYVDLDGDPLVMERLVETSKARNDADNEALAARKQGRTENKARHLDLTIDLDDLDEIGQVGDTIWVYDLETGLYARANVAWSGADPVYPLASRIVEAATPFHDRHGIYLRWWDGAGFQITDLTAYVTVDTGKVTVTVGDPKRRLGVARPSRAA